MCQQLGALIWISIGHTIAENLVTAVLPLLGETKVEFQRMAKTHVPASLDWVVF